MRSWACTRRFGRLAYWSYCLRVDLWLVGPLMQRHFDDAFWSAWRSLASKQDADRFAEWGQTLGVLAHGSNLELPYCVVDLKVFSFNIHNNSQLLNSCYYIYYLHIQTLFVWSRSEAQLIHWNMNIIDDLVVFLCRYRPFLFFRVSLPDFLARIWVAALKKGRASGEPGG